MVDPWIIRYRGLPRSVVSVAMDPVPDLRISMPDEGSLVVRQTAHEYVRSVLRRAILNGELSSGSRLVQAELAAMLKAMALRI